MDVLAIAPPSLRRALLAVSGPFITQFMRQSFTATLILIGLLCPATAFAQPEGGGPDPAKVRVRMGPLWMNPSIAVTNLGIDQNVFNDTAANQPKQDFTLTVTPRTDLWLHMGRTWLIAVIDEEIVWYQTYSSERSANNRYSLGWRLPTTWVNLNLTTRYTKARERPGYEIDLRAPRTELSYTGAVEGRIMSKTYFGVRAERQKVNFDESAVFLDASLHDQLNHITSSAAVTLRQQVTPLTSVEFNATRSQDRFEFEPLRNSRSTSVGAAVTFDPFALVKGTAAFGYRKLSPDSPDVPEYTGGTMAVDLTYTLLGMTRLTRPRPARRPGTRYERLPAVLPADRRRGLGGPANLRTLRRDVQVHRAAARLPRPRRRPGRSGEPHRRDPLARRRRRLSPGQGTAPRVQRGQSAPRFGSRRRVRTRA